MTKAWFKCRTLQVPTKMPKNRMTPLRSAAVDMNPRGFNMAVIAEIAWEMTLKNFSLLIPSVKVEEGA